MGYGRHLRQRGGAAHFRRVVPKDLVERFGRREIVRSIGALPAFERHSQSRRFSVACDEAFAMVRSEPTLTRQDIDRLVDVYLGDLANRDREYASWQPRRPIDQAGFRRRTQIGVYSELARSVVDARRTNAPLIDDDVLREVATKAGLSFDPDSLDPILIEDALGEALARFYAQRADELRNEARIGESAPLRRWLRGLLAIAVPQPPTAAHSTVASAPATPTREAGRARTPADGGVKHEATAEARQEPVASAVDDSGADIRLPNGAASDLDEVQDMAEQSAENRDPNSFGALWASFVHTKVSLRREWKPSRKPELLGTSRLWVWIIGDLSAGQYTSHHIRKFHDTYLTLPADYMRLRQTRTGMLSPSDVVGKATLTAEKEAKRTGKTRAEFQRVNPKTFNKHLANLKAFFVWEPVVEARPKDAPDPTRGFHIKIDKTTNAVRAERNMAPPKSIAELFGSPYWTGRASEYFLTRPGGIIVRDSLYWIPLMVAFHGLRREEAAQLRVHHIKSVVVTIGDETVTIWYFDFTAEDLVLKEPARGSPRQVPLHRNFMRLGFLEDKVFGRKPEEHLFSELSNENAHAAFGVSIGKRFGNYVAGLEFSEKSFRDDLSLQAMRHTVRTLLDNTSAKESFVDELLGHESEERRSEARRYRKEVYLQNLKVTIDLLELPIDVERLRELALEMAPIKRKK